MPTHVFNFCNLYIPEDTVYENTDYNLRIEPTDVVEEFEDQRRDLGSRYSTGYWHTATCYIDAEQDRAEELAEWLTFIYSFAQNRDVTWADPSYTFAIDNTNLKLIQMMWSPPDNRGIGEFIDTALETLDTASEQKCGRILRSLSLFLEASGDTF